MFNDLLDVILTDKTLMSSKDENENENDNINVIKWRWWSNGSKQKNITIKKLNDHLDKIIDKSKSFEDQMEVENLNEFYFINGYGDRT